MLCCKCRWWLTTINSLSFYPFIIVYDWDWWSLEGLLFLFLVFIENRNGIRYWFHHHGLFQITLNFRILRILSPACVHFNSALFYVRIFTDFLFYLSTSLFTWSFIYICLHFHSLRAICYHFLFFFNLIIPPLHDKENILHSSNFNSIHPRTFMN